MNSSKTSITGMFCAFGSNVANNLYFWICLVGFVFSVFGFILTRQALYGFSYGFFGIFLASILVAAWKKYESAKVRGTRNRSTDPQDFD